MPGHFTALRHKVGRPRPELEVHHLLLDVEFGEQVDKDVAVGVPDLALQRANVADTLYEAIKTRSDGTQRITTASKCMISARRAWNVVHRIHPQA